MICRSTAVWTLVVFALGWIGGSIFFVSYMALFEDEGSIASKSSALRNYGGAGLKSEVTRKGDFDFELSSSYHVKNKPPPSNPTLLESSISLIKSIKADIDHTLTSSAQSSSTLTKSEDLLPENGILPRFDKNSSTRDDDDVQTWIHMDFPVDDRLLTLENYKVLESMLSVYPTANIRVWIAGPNDAYTHKIGNQVSVSQFDKYKKRGYNIETMPVARMNKGFISQIGKEYWDKYGALCCFKCGPACRRSDHVQPYHVLNFIRLNKLWRRGGIFNDFSFFFFGNLDRPLFRQGFQIGSYCDYGDDYQTWEEQQEDQERFVTKKCFSSTLLIFNEEKSEAILCVLKQYESKDFLDCIEGDTEFGGAGCVHTAFTMCFDTLGLDNDLATDSSSGSLVANDNRLLNSSAGSSHIKLMNWETLDRKLRGVKVSAGKQSPVENFNFDPELARSMLLRSSDWRLKKYVRTIWIGDLAFKGGWPTLLASSGSIDRTGYSIRSHSIGASSLLANAIQTIKLKPLDFDHICSYIPDDGSFSGLLTPNSHDNSKSNGSSISIDHANNGNSLNTCSHYSMRLSTLLLDENRQDIPEEKRLSFNTNIEYATCAPSIIIPGFMKSASSFLFTLLEKHPLILRPLKGSQLKETHCYHSTPKRKLLHRMWCYPFVSEEDGLLDVEGDEKDINIDADFKSDASNGLLESESEQESGGDDNANELTGGEKENRRLSSLRGGISATPSPSTANGSTTNDHSLSTSILTGSIGADKVIDPITWKKLIRGMKRGFSILDGTIYYGTDAEAARSISEDNKNAKAIFVVRHPVDRIYSNYKFAFETYGKKGSFDNLTMMGTARWDKFGQLRDMFTNNTDLARIDSYYFGQPFSQSSALGVLFMHSIVAPSIMHYQNVLGKENVLVITSDDLEISKTDPTNKLRQVQSTMNRVFRFLNLCPIKIPDSVAPVLAGRNSIPDDKDMSQDVYQKLNKFFAPFNDALAKLVPNINITHWNTKPAPSHLRKFTFNSNSSLPEMWFEKEMHEAASSGFGKIMSHLLPQKIKEEEEDSSFNTTLGMLISFR